MKSEPSRSSIITNLYSLIAVLAMLSFGLGADVCDLANNAGRGPYKMNGWHILHIVSVCITALAIPFLAFVVHKLIQRLLSLTRDQSQGDRLSWCSASVLEFLHHHD